MEILILLIGFYLINILTNHLAVMSPFLSMLVYFIAVMALFQFINKIRLNRAFQKREKMIHKQNQEFHNWQQETASKEYQKSSFKVRDDIIDVEYTETEIKE